MARKKVTHKINLKPIRLSDKELQKRIEMVVAKAKMNETGIQHDVVRHINRPLNLRKGGSRIG